MNEMLAAIDSAEAASVPALCLVLADWLSERADPEAEGWLALGRLGKVPDYHALDYFWWSLRHGHHHDAVALPASWWWKIRGVSARTRSLALRAAAIAFVGLDEAVKRCDSGDDNGGCDVTRLPFDELLKQIPKHTPPEEPPEVWERRIAEGQKLLEEAANNPPKPCPTCGEDEAYCDCEEE